MQFCQICHYCRNTLKCCHIAHRKMFVIVQLQGLSILQIYNDNDDYYYYDPPVLADGLWRRGADLIEDGVCESNT